METFVLFSWYGIALHLDQKNNFLRVFQAVFENHVTRSHMFYFRK